MRVEEIGRIIPGNVYRYHLTVEVDGEPPRDVEFDLYRVEDFVTDPVRHQELVLYIGLENGDKGKRYVCTRWDFAIKFRPVSSPGSENGEAVSGKEWGYISQSVHV